MVCVAPAEFAPSLAKSRLVRSGRPQIIPSEITGPQTPNSKPRTPNFGFMATYLLINYEYPPLGGGAATASRNLAMALKRKGNRVVILTSAYGELRGALDESGV